jgi:hypothetical protein
MYLKLYKYLSIDRINFIKNKKFIKELLGGILKRKLIKILGFFRNCKIRKKLTTSQVII